MFRSAVPDSKNRNSFLLENAAAPDLEIACINGFLQLPRRLGLSDRVHRQGRCTPLLQKFAIEVECRAIDLPAASGQHLSQPRRLTTQVLSITCFFVQAAPGLGCQQGRWLT